MLNGIDVSSNEPRDICRRVDYDFAIVKATGNPQGYRWDYVNPYMADQADDVLSRGKVLGLYHFCWGKDDPEVEAAHFCANVAPYVGRALLVADYEAEALALGRDWLGLFCAAVKARTGVTPIIYASASVIIEQGLPSLG